MASPRRLPVDGDDVRLFLPQRLNPGGEASLKQIGVKRVNHGVGGKAAFARQKTPQKIKPFIAPKPDLHEILHAGQCGAENEQEYFGQRIQHTPVLARIA
jgi:hypothetical protein